MLRSRRLFLGLVLVGCGGSPPRVEAPVAPVQEPVQRPKEDIVAPRDSFRKAFELLQAQTDVVLLKSADERNLVAVVPRYQGRVMTSSMGGLDGRSLGWVNSELIQWGRTVPQMNPYGGEDRFWLGPEGGQFGLFFQPGTSFDFENWNTPAVIDTEPFMLESKSEREAVFASEMRLVNHSGTEFEVGVKRTVRLLDRQALPKLLGTGIPDGVELVAFESENVLTNQGDQAWTKERGLLSIWILGMFNPSPTTVVVLPFVPGAEATHGAVVNDAYFGKVPADRLRIGTSAIFFKGDGQYRSKIGLSPRRAKPIMGSYDTQRQLLTLVQFTMPQGATDYVNSMWERQANPFTGDVSNSYNDGPNPSGVTLGPFYELESSSPALALEPRQSFTHLHRTLHVRGSESDLDRIAQALLGVTLDQISRAFASPAPAPAPAPLPPAAVPAPSAAGTN